MTVLAAEQTPTSEHWYQGTADAVRQSNLHIRSYPHDHVLILSGDQLYTMDYRLMLEHHRRTGADITIAATPVTAAEAPGFGILKTDAEHRITEFYEKPGGGDLAGKESPVTPAMAGRRAHLPGVDGHLHLQLPGAAGRCSTATATPTTSASTSSRWPSPSGRWWRIRSPGTGTTSARCARSSRRNLMLTDPRPAFNLFDEQMPLYTDARLLPPAKVTRSRIDASIIAEACVVIDSDIEQAVIGIRSYLGARTRIRRVVMMGADYYRWEDPASRNRVEGPPRPGVDEDSVVEGAIIDKNASIGRNCVITNTAGVQEGEGPGFYIRDGIVVIVKNAEIADGTVI